MPLPFNRKYTIQYKCFDIVIHTKFNRTRNYPTVCRRQNKHISVIIVIIS